jgi:PTH1 family peptidyl-tRNA hydrolase
VGAVFESVRAWLRALFAPRRDAQGSAAMKLIVGLGNPGAPYRQTRHNVGFEVVGRLARRLQAQPPRVKFEGEISEATVAGEKVLLLTPLTYMNASGASVLAVRDFYKLAPEHILVICDDLALPLGKLRLRAKGSSGGQKGLDDILRRLSTDEVPRLRIGIGPLPPGRDAAQFVLARFTPEERPVIDAALDRAAEAALVWVQQGIVAAMNQFNPN